MNRLTDGKAWRGLPWLSVAALPLLAGCPLQQGQVLPPCIDASAKTAAPATPETRAKELIVGVDGSGSMLGHVRATDPSTWTKLLQSVNLAAKTQGLPIKAFRVGGGIAKPFGAGGVTPATDPCFFEGCGSYTPVASSLQTLWNLPSKKGEVPLRLMISDLEVNQNDITSLVGSIQKDLDRRATVGILGVRVPFKGKVFNASGKVIHNGQAERPVYLLATGEARQVKELLEDIDQNLKGKGIQKESHLSLLSSSEGQPTLRAKSVQILPSPKDGESGFPRVRLNGNTYQQGANEDYQFITLRPTATAILVSTIKPWKGGTTRPDPGLVRIEPIPFPSGPAPDLNGVKLKSIAIAGSNLRAEIEIDPATPSGLLRATIPRGSVPSQWWMQWDRGNSSGAESINQTDGLLLLLTKLGGQVQQTDQTPAIALCVAFQRT